MNFRYLRCCANSISFGRAADAETNNVRHFVALVARWAGSGEEHCGVLLTSDASMPRGKHSIGLYVDTLRRLMAANPGTRALANQVSWLP